MVWARRCWSLDKSFGHHVLLVGMLTSAEEMTSRVDIVLVFMSGDRLVVVGD